MSASDLRSAASSEPPQRGATSEDVAESSTASASPAAAHHRATMLPPSERLRHALAVTAGRTAGSLARKAHRGGGTSLPGLVARRVSPTVVSYLGAQLRHGSVVITGTNGKTTTSGLTAYVLRASDMRVWRNREGANLMRGITAALIIRSELTGHLRWGGNAAAVFEVDEAAFPQAVAELRPRAVVVTNLFRDQLDRYGEVHAVAEHWRSAFATLPPETILVLNADDPAVASLATPERAERVLYFGLNAPIEAEPPVASQDELVNATDVLDTRTCPRCQGTLSFSVRFYSHVGHWACPSCGYARPEPAIRADQITERGLDDTGFRLITPAGERMAQIALPGLYNVYNALAAAAVGYAMDVGIGAIVDAVRRFTPAFGRAERIMVDGRDVRLLLAKNPTGLNEVLRALAHARLHAGPGLSADAAPHLLMLLNDHLADGQDVSWIWDADFEQMRALAPTRLTTGGTRANDLALRLKYAGARVDAIIPEIPAALSAALEATPSGNSLVVIPTFTAMLAVRGELERLGYAPHYWEQRDV